jgi:hypothetical protein
MQTLRTPAKGAEKILLSLAEFDYLTTEQITPFCYSPASLSFLRKKLKMLIAEGFVLALEHNAITVPHVYTLTGTGYAAAHTLGMPKNKRVRPREETGKAGNLFFIQHTIAVTDVLIAARLLSQTVPGIELNRLYLERELKRKIYVETVLPIEESKTQRRTTCLEPDAAVDFIIHGKWQDFFHIEVYRTHLRESRFKQKIVSYTAYAASTIHQELFHTPALAVAVCCQTGQMARTLKRWTEEVLQEVQQPELGERFFFTSVNPASVSPEELFLSPVWEQACGTTKTLLLVLE